VAYIFDIGGPHTYRTIYIDGRTHPEHVTRSYYGHSIGWWEADTLVVDTVGFNEGFWIDRGQIPHSDRLHLIEKYTRTALDTMRYELTIDDPGAYTAPFTGTSNLRWENGTELFEYVCQQANQAHTLMVGGRGSSRRTENEALHAPHTRVIEHEAARDRPRAFLPGSPSREPTSNRRARLRIPRPPSNGRGPSWTTRR
jgi:hypothetical protein